MRVLGIAAALAFYVSVVCAAGAPEPKLAGNVVPAPFGYEAAPGQYVVAEETPVYVSTFIYPGTVDKTKLAPGTPVTALAKAKDYDWILISKDGIGIGYIPLSRLTAAKGL